MSSFSRSFKLPTYLSRPRRPGMGGRTLSSSSDASARSTNSNDQGTFSGANTPTAERARSPPSQDVSTAPGASGPAQHEASSTEVESFPSRFNRANPIAIELPKIRKFNSTPGCTPPAPLSARGDLPGGYFPLHEDPEKRVHRQHPFHHDTLKARHQSISSASDLSASYTTRPSHTPTLKALTMSISQAEATTPVASYLPIGVHDTPLPMGKYYPSNYENRNRGTVGHSSTASSIRSTHTESDAKARLQQYQRDMITQTKMAAKDILGNNAQRAGSSSAPPSLGPFFLGATGVHLGAAFTAPISPRLNPLGSPGPVTPMNLEEAGGDYLSKGQSALGVDPAGASRLEQQRGRWT